MKKAVHTLPEGYRKIFALDLHKDKNMLTRINALSLLISFVMIVPGHKYISVFTMFDYDQGAKQYLLRWGVTLGLMVGYIFAHELMHGLVMKLFGTKTVRFGFQGTYAYACSHDYYPKAAYTLIALAPVVVWGIVLAVVNVLVPADWFWVVYLIQIINVSGAAGDLYVTYRFLAMPKDILVRDSGVAMAVYSATCME
jgi:hypothetical protein